MHKKISIIGAGSWGTALAIALTNNNFSPVMWSISEEEIDFINIHKEHVKKLPGVQIPDRIKCTGDIEECVSGAELILLVIPAQTIRQNCKLLSKHINKDSIIVNCAKGLEIETGLRLSQVIEQEIPNIEIATLSGPSHAEEVAQGMPTAIVATSNNNDIARLVQNIFMSPTFRVYTNSDVVGVELGGALKNIIALCAGICDGLGLGDNTKAALMTRAITEMSRLGVALGAKLETFSGLTGIGDLIVTCTSMHSRNRRAGIMIGSGKSLEQTQKDVGMVVEGISTTQAAYKMSKTFNVETPIIDATFDVLFNKKDPGTIVFQLMSRSKKDEITDLF